MHRALEVEVLGELRDVAGVGVHLVTVEGLRRAAVSAAIVGDHAKPFREEEHELRIPVVARERPSVMEDERLSTAQSL